MSQPVRIGLRVLGAVMVAVGVAALVLLVVPGPRDVAEWMGKNCSHTSIGRMRPSESCNALDVLEWLTAAPILIVVGAVLLLALGRDADDGALGQPLTIDLRRGPSPNRPTRDFAARSDIAAGLRASGVDAELVQAFEQSGSFATAYPGPPPSPAELAALIQARYGEGAIEQHRGTTPIVGST